MKNMLSASTAKIRTMPSNAFLFGYGDFSANRAVGVALFYINESAPIIARQQQAEDRGTNKINDLARDSLFHGIPPEMMEAPAGGGAVVRQHPLNLLRPCIEKPPWVVLPDSAIIPYTPLGAKGF